MVLKSFHWMFFSFGVTTARFPLFQSDYLYISQYLEYKITGAVKVVISARELINSYMLLINMHHRE